mmetsp:Transcript_11200/g.45574  ORF Transcript_11200/g.45574 Transcript_11200/m.45574 type:complete len:369 (+) Transcript_11200:58-1164(+)
MAEADKAHFWLRHEVKPFEHRTPVLPRHAKRLLDAGYKVSVERSPARCVEDAKYEEVGCTMVATGSWATDAPADAVILGLKELPEDVDALQHRHIFFGHCFKGQGGWKEMIGRFVRGGGSVYDVEFCVNDTGRRVAAFGRAAGYVGMAAGIQAWAAQQAGGGQLGALEPYKDFSALAAATKELVEKQAGGRAPRVIVIGALGRAGNGAVDAALASGVPEENITKWDLAETKVGGPFPVIVSDYDIMVNCVYLSSYIPPFVTEDMLDVGNRRLSVLVDVSCDTTNPNNPVPVYKTNSTFPKPVIRRRNPADAVAAFDVISIDHLPSLVPFESSIEFGDDLCTHLLEFDQSPVWQRAIKLFREKVEEASA